MPVIKKIKILKNKVKLQLEDSSVIEMDKNVYSNFYLYVGKDLSKKEIKAIETFNDTSTYMNYALKLRQKSLYSEYHMREKLYDKGANKEQVDFVIKKLKENGLIDDKVFIEEYIEYYNSLNYGKNKIISKLKEKGIFEDKLEKVNFPISIERKKANNQLPKLEKRYEKYNETQKKQHIYQALLSLGFDVEIAKEVSDKVRTSSPREENKKLERDFEKALAKYKRKYQKRELKSKLIGHLASKGYKINDIMSLMERKGL